MVERYIDIVKAIGSIPIPPMINRIICKIDMLTCGEMRVRVEKKKLFILSHLKILSSS